MSGGRRTGPPSAVTFDCWNTLLYEEDWHEAHLLRVEALRAAAAEVGRPVDLETGSRTDLPGLPAERLRT